MMLQLAIVFIGALSFLHLIWVANSINYDKTRMSLKLSVVLGAGFSVGMAISALQNNLTDALTFTLVVLASYVIYHFDLDLTRPRQRHIERRWRSGPSIWQSSTIE